MILASASPRRRELLSSLGAVFSVKICDVPELAGVTEEFSAAGVPVENARRKAAAVAEMYPDEIVLGADTVIIFEEEIFGKPRDNADAVRMLNIFSGKEHYVVTAVSLIGKNAALECSWSCVTKVKFKKLTPEIINSYLSAVNVLDKAGAYAVQEHGDMIIETVDGELSNVIGLPLERLKRELTLLGVI